MSRGDQTGVNNAPIGVFDSGIGGLTILKALNSVLPREHFIYVADGARAPYGSKDIDTVRHYALQITDFLLNCGVKLIVIACTTASSVAADAVRQRAGKVPVFEVITQGTQAVFDVLPCELKCVKKGDDPTRAARIALLGTKLTVESGVYRKHVTEYAIRHYLREPIFIEQSCPRFVSLVDDGVWNGPLADRVAKRYLNDVRAFKPDVVILGCTHYPVLSESIRKALEPNVHLTDSALYIARMVEKTLRNENMMREGRDEGRLMFLSSDAPDTFREHASRFLDRDVDIVHHVDLESLERNLLPIICSYYEEPPMEDNSVDAP